MEQLKIIDTLETYQRLGHCSVVMDGFVVAAAAASRKMSRLKQYKTDIVNLKWDSNIMSNR